MSLERHLKVVVAGGSLEVCGAASTALSEICDAVPTSIPGSKITTGPHPSLSEREPFARRSALSGACADIDTLSIEAATMVQAQFVHTKTRERVSSGTYTASGTPRRKVNSCRGMTRPAISKTLY